MVRPGTLEGVRATAIAVAAMMAATARLAVVFHGSSFSAAISAAISSIHPTLITPSANRPAISAQQQPTHQAPCSTPMRSAPVGPSRHACVMNCSGPRQRRRHASFAGVSW